MNTPPAPCLEEVYTTDMMPAWRYLLWKLDPRRLICRKAELQWTTELPTQPGLYIRKTSMPYFTGRTMYKTVEIYAAGQIHQSETPSDDLWYGPIPLNK